MRVLVTGAGGFVGTALVERLLRDGIAEPGDVSELLWVDRQAEWPDDDVRITALVGDFSRPEMLEPPLSTPVDVVFHLASLPGSQAEAEPAEGDRVNLSGMLALFERLATQATEHGRAARVVYASSVAVLGESLPASVDEHTVPRPTMSYGVHKLVGELILADWTRRGKLDGRALRLPGIVARPAPSAGHGSAFMSQIFRAAQSGQPYTCPVSPSATAWWMSRSCCVDNLLHAARMSADGLHAGRVWTPPVLHLSVREIVDALVRRFGAFDIDYAPVERIERLFGRQPPLTDRRAIEAGFRHDGTIDALVTHALELSS
ncbi:TPA: NAD-dependent epimerase/dehydratase family protein [Burkholderia multivorans]|uniref:NAD-dependent epimerase/dehydratase family protein n=1 Tax=Burkholderia multivorans TaxID=87883 RepID=UPI00158D2A69|nr:NAD-dependent epimerase/dehydratase family protein [Burkholderia multivorans]MBU9318476.1 NAD-dependent epimerase/dehydratase family protein [Burkholderia multivorans]MDN7941875.1 NAD-dependent epimerase/dehydratase family protein [Burkholderia multivorans]HEF4740402.1 NAD-dependent epimerase/dehydratase family protein [Burkholderia multivorans]